MDLLFSSSATSIPKKGETTVTMRMMRRTVVASQGAAPSRIRALRGSSLLDFLGDDDSRRRKRRKTAAEQDPRLLGQDRQHHYYPHSFRRGRVSGITQQSILLQQQPLLKHWHHQQQVRYISSFLPEALQTVSIWGGSGFLLKTIHSDTWFPWYWACFAAISIGVRVALLPLVLHGAHTASRFAKVVPEVQFLLSLFRSDLMKLRMDHAPLSRRLQLMRTNLATLGGIYKLHQIHPFAVFLSPLLQMPIFIYISADLRKITNGLDPMLAQQLVDITPHTLGWITDLTEPDPWFGLPIAAGLIMYMNVEVALGRRSLSGPAAAKSDTGLLLKDVFQSVAVFMPSFTSHLPAGVQIYVVTSFAFTLVQSRLLRTESFRVMVGLPSLLAPPAEAKYATKFIELKQLEQKARELRGADGPVLGKHGVLAANFEASFAGSDRPSTIKGSGIVHDLLPQQHPLSLQTTPASSSSSSSTTTTTATTTRSTPFIPGVSAPAWQLAEQQQEQKQQESGSADFGDHQHHHQQQQQQQREYMPQYSDEVMDKANRGERPVPTQFDPDFFQQPDSTATGASSTTSSSSSISLKGVQKKVTASGKKKKNKKK